MAERWITSAGSGEHPGAEKKFEANISFDDYSYLVGNGDTLQEAHQDLVAKVEAAGMNLSTMGGLGQRVLAIAKTGVVAPPQFYFPVPEWANALPSDLPSGPVVEHTVTHSGAPPQVRHTYDEATKRHTQSLEVSGQTFSAEGSDSSEAGHALGRQLKAAEIQADLQNPYDPISQLFENLARHERDCVRYPGGVAVPPRFDFRKAFLEGRTFETSIAKEIESVTIKVDSCGNLQLPSGVLVARDPSSNPSEGTGENPLTARLNPGSYPVFVSIAELSAGDGRVVCAMLRISGGDPVRWEQALEEGQDLRTLKPGLMFGYGVDAGIGCFADVEAAGILASEEQAKAHWMELPKSYKAICMGLGNHGKHVNIEVDAEKKLNVIAFSSGWGDGCYESFWGYDAAGERCCLVTDFALFDASVWDEV